MMWPVLLVLAVSTNALTLPIYDGKALDMVKEVSNDQTAPCSKWGCWNVPVPWLNVCCKTCINDQGQFYGSCDKLRKTQKAHHHHKSSKKHKKHVVEVDQEATAPSKLGDTIDTWCCMQDTNTILNFQTTWDGSGDAPDSTPAKVSVGTPLCIDGSVYNVAAGSFSNAKTDGVVIDTGGKDLTACKSPSSCAVYLESCPAADCKTPTHSGGGNNKEYNLAGAKGPQAIDGFNPSGVTCAEGYSGTVAYTVCEDHGREYGLSGCKAKAKCSTMTDTTCGTGKVNDDTKDAEDCVGTVCTVDLDQNCCKAKAVPCKAAADRARPTVGDQVVILCTEGSTGADGGDVDYIGRSGIIAYDDKGGGPCYKVEFNDGDVVDRWFTEANVDKVEP